MDGNLEGYHGWRSDPDMKHVEVHYTGSKIGRDSLSRFVLSQLISKCSNDPRNPGMHRVWHDGPVTPADIEITEAEKRFFETEYLPEYRKYCEEHNLPKLR